MLFCEEIQIYMHSLCTIATTLLHANQNVYIVYTVDYQPNKSSEDPSALLHKMIPKSYLEPGAHELPKVAFGGS